MLPVRYMTILQARARDVTIYTARALHQEQHAAALAMGLKAHGIVATIKHDSGGPLLTKHVACWGWRQGVRLRHMGHEVLVMERGYIAPPGDPDQWRFKWTSLGWNGLNGRAKFYPKDDPARFDTNFRHLLKDWKAGGKYVLLIGQVPGDASLGGMNLNAWYATTALAAAKAYNLPVRFRPHPVAIQRRIHQDVRGVQTINGTLDEAFANAAICVTFNSNTAVEAVLAGVPTVATDIGSMAHEVTSRKIGDILTPDREQWAARLAWCQWTMDEIKSGAAWEAIQPH